MADQIETFYRQAYIDFIRLNAMQQESVLSPTVDQEQMRGEALNLDKYNRTNLLRERTTRVADNQDDQIRRNRRQVNPRFWDFTEYFDPRDEVRLLRSIRPDSQYARAVLSIFGRQKDVLIIDGALADVQDDDGNTSDFGQDGGRRFAAAGTTLAVDDIIKAKFELENTETQMDVMWYAAMHPTVKNSLLSDSTAGGDRLTSWDFNALRPLQAGQVTMFMGFEFRTTTMFEFKNPLSLGGTGYESYFYASDAIVWAADGDVEVHFDIIADKGHSLQVAHYSTMNAVRMHGEKIVVFESNETDATLAETSPGEGGNVRPTIS